MLSVYCCVLLMFSIFFFFQAEDGIRDFCLSRGLGDVYKRQDYRGICHKGNDVEFGFIGEKL